MYAARLHSSCVQRPTTSDAASLKHTLRYIKGTMDYRPVLGRHLQCQIRQWHGEPFPIHVNAYTDSDWAGDIKTRKSTSGYIISVMGVPLSFASPDTAYHLSQLGRSGAYGFWQRAPLMEQRCCA